MQWQNPRFFPYINLLMFYIYCTQIGNKIRPKLPYIKTLIILLKNKIYFFFRIFFHTFRQSVYLATTRRIAQNDDSRLELFSSLIEYFFRPRRQRVRLRQSHRINCSVEFLIMLILYGQPQPQQRTPWQRTTHRIIWRTTKKFVRVYETRKKNKIQCETSANFEQCS